MQAQHNKEHPKPHRLEIVYNGLVWSFVGALYAALFIPVFEVVLQTLPLWVAALCATVAATVGGALVYSSHQLALLVAIFTNFAVFAQLLHSGEIGSPLPPIVGGAATGAIVGALYGLTVKESRIYSAEAKLLAGTTVGFLVSVISLIWILVFGASLTILVAILAPLSGLIYVQIVNNFIARYSDLLPPFADGAVAGAVIGGFIGVGLWVVGGIVLGNTVAQWQEAISGIASSTPLAMAAASISTLLLRMLYGVLGFRFKDSSKQS